MIGGLVRANLAMIDRIDGDLGRRVRGHMRPELVTLIEEASRLTWLPVKADVELTRSLFAVAGDHLARRTIRKAQKEAVSTPLLRPILQAAVRLNHDRLPGLIKWAPKVWTVIYRDCGMLVVESDAKGGNFVFAGLPQIIMDTPVYVAGMAPAMEGLLEGMGTPGTVQVDSSYGRPSAIRIRLDWSAEALARVSIIPPVIR